MISMPSRSLFAVAYSIALMTSLVRPCPFPSSTFSTIKRALGATPRYRF